MPNTNVQTISVLGSTGSIGVQALEVAGRLSLRVAALAAGRNAALLEQQIRAHRPAVAALFDEAAARDLRVRVADTGTRVLSGAGGVCEAAAIAGADLTLNAIVGIAGLRPTLAALEAGHPVALANKETLVAAGDLVMAKAKEKGLPLLPVDSEHSAIFQCLQGRPPSGSFRILLTASGGPFFGRTRQDLQHITPADALKHPNWDMGAKITIDSATLMNKGLEIIEAVHLFQVPPEAVTVLVHRQSIVHSCVEYEDGSVVAQLGVPDMRIPIQYAITYPHRTACPAPRLSLTEVGALTFCPPDTDTFTCLAASIAAIKAGGLCPAAVNGANEQAVALFLAKKTPFLQIGELVAAAGERASKSSGYTLADVFEADRAAREFVLSNT